MNITSSHPSSDASAFRNLNKDETKQLIKNGNIAEEWNKIYISENFDPSLVRNCHFWGENYINGGSSKKLSSGNLILPVGLYNSVFYNCVIHSDTAIHNVAYLYNYIISANCLLFNINELSCSKIPVFGNGFPVDNSEKKRNWMAVANENEGRKILPFEGMLSADAYLWSRFRDDKKLMECLIKMTDKLNKKQDLSRGIIENNCVIKNVKTIEDCKIGNSCIIDGAHKLKNLTILSSTNEPTVLGDDVELENGIVGFNNNLFAGAKCFDFVTGRNVKIEMGARILNTFIGSNSTIACCEVLNNLLFPFHEQHHNNSFLIASTIKGQSNIAAGATIGSNHNSRAADGEIIAGRGFWPGLESDFKHNSVFASFTLVAKGSYETELYVKLPFSLISKDNSGNLQIFPAFWFRYNMYALARNSWKFQTRDKRIVKSQNIEMDYLAPDTAFEILEGIDILENAVKQAGVNLPSLDEYNFQKIDDLNNIFLQDMAPKLKTLIIKPLQALWIYKIVLSYYAAREIVRYLLSYPATKITGLFSNFHDIHPWSNFGGQLITENDRQQLISDIRSRKLDSWQAIHKRYNTLWQKYPENKMKFALACWLKKENKTAEQISERDIKALLTHSVNINNAFLKWTIEARMKDYSNPFRQSTFSNSAEMDAVIGHFKDDVFIKDMQEENKRYLKRVNTIISKIT